MRKGKQSSSCFFLLLIGLVGREETQIFCHVKRPNGISVTTSELKNNRFFPPLSYSLSPPPITRKAIFLTTSNMKKCRFFFVACIVILCSVSVVICFTFSNSEAVFYWLHLFSFSFPHRFHFFSKNLRICSLPKMVVARIIFGRYFVPHLSQQRFDHSSFLVDGSFQRNDGE